MDEEYCGFECCGFDVSHHAFLRFTERSSRDFTSDESAREIFTETFAQAVPVNYFGPITLWRNGDWVFAIDTDESVVTTCYISERGK